MKSLALVLARALSLPAGERSPTESAPAPMQHERPARTR